MCGKSASTVLWWDPVSNGWVYPITGATCGTAFFSPTAADGVKIALFFSNTSNTSAITQIYCDIGTLVINSYLISCVGTVVKATLCANVTTAVTEGGGPSAPAEVGKKYLTTVMGNTFTIP